MRVRSDVRFLILRGFFRICAGLLNHLGQHSLERRALQAHRRRFDRKCLRAKGFHLKSVGFQFLGNPGENDHLPRFQLHQQRHQQALALDFFDLPIAQNFFKKHPLVSHMLVDYPQAVVSGGQDERLAQLAQRAQRTQVVQIGGGLFRLDQGSLRRCAGRVACSDGQARPAAIGGAIWRKKRRSGTAQTSRLESLDASTSRDPPANGSVPGTGQDGTGSELERLRIWRG